VSLGVTALRFPEADIVLGATPKNVSMVKATQLTRGQRLSRPIAPKSPRPTRADFLQAYRAAVTRKLKVFTKRENVAMAREALRNVLAEGKLVLRPDVANARVEGTLTLSHEEFLQEKQIDIKLVAGARNSNFRRRIKLTHD